ncbi:phosphotransferase [Schaalia vaccimaxillae]|uniref:phosphotransferase n=1 Tax=Schaalia vaccimaxillae TaxID=183916 RepID=UPI001039BDB9|nr:phosphotransferase [Schaalia vaccimaxillae]
MNRAKTPLELAALATAAVPGLQVAGLKPPQYCDEVMSVTGLIDRQGNRWTVSCPHDTVGGLDIDAQSGVLDHLAKARDAKRIPFDVPRIHGSTRTPEGDRVIVHQDLGGRNMQDFDFEDHHVLPASLGRALAALHNLPKSVYTLLDLPSYSASECRERQLALLDEAAAQVLIPANLWDRWEAALEDLSLWRFQSVPVHADLQDKAIIVDNGAVTAMTGFSSAHVGDPAQDIAWILARSTEEFLEGFSNAYTRDRNGVDLQLFVRAQLLSELAIVRWLVHGLHAEDRSIVEEARQMLSELSQDLGEDQLVTPQAPIAPLKPDTAEPRHEESGHTVEEPSADETTQERQPSLDESARGLDAGEPATEKLRLDSNGYPLV